MEESPTAAPSPSQPEGIEEFAVSVVRMWKRDERVQMRILNRTGLQPGDEHTTSVATTDIEEALAVMRTFITDFVGGE